CLLKAAGVDAQESAIDSQTIAFMLAPRINAAGRMERADIAADLLLCESEEFGYTQAARLTALNTARGEEEKRILEEINAQLAENPALLNERVLVLSGQGWHHGVIGIIAARMVTRFGKPCFVISRDEHGGLSKGSARNVSGFSVIDALNTGKELLYKYGGHIGAGGFSLEEENIAEFTQRLYDFCQEQYSELGSSPVAQITADLSPDNSDLTVANVKGLAELGPFGEGNPVPVFYLAGCTITHKRPLKEGKYIAFTAQYRGTERKLLEFGKPYADFWYKIGDVVDVMVNIDINEYNGNESLSIKVIAMRLSGITRMQERFFAARDVYEQIAKRQYSKIDSALYARIIPDEACLKAVYDLLKSCAFSVDEVVQRGLHGGMNYCMLRVAIDVFSEVGLIELNPVSGEFKLVTGVKADLNKSALLGQLKNMKEAQA
ncbi:MAG: DHH family phosphoesterase, partial [Oscillospiraceae bacterium]|nr:DHH family phosphoesterase [Oscillospiraceae bacterium]